MLPASPVAVGATWTGAPVHGDGSTCSARAECCAAVECRDGGPCLSEPWRERLIGAERGVAEIESTWRGPTISATRHMRIELASGLPLDAQLSVRHQRTGVVRTLTMARGTCTADERGGTAQPGPA
jgi:hypothetical protein